MTINNNTSDMESIEFHSNDEIHEGVIEDGVISQYDIYFPTLGMTLYLSTDKECCEYISNMYNGPQVVLSEKHFEDSFDIYSNRVETDDDKKIPIRWKFSKDVVDFTYKDAIIEDILEEQKIIDEYEYYLISILKSDNVNIDDYHNVMIYDTLKFILPPIEFEI